MPNIAGLTRHGIARRAMELLDDVIMAHPQDAPAGHRRGQRRRDRRRVLPGRRRRDIRIASDDRLLPRRRHQQRAHRRASSGISYLLPRAIGSSRAFDIMLSGRDVDAAEAERIGLVSRTVPADDLLDACYELAARIIRVQPRRRRGHQAAAVVEPRRGQPHLAHGPRGPRPAVRPHDDTELRRGDPRPPRGPPPGLPRLNEGSAARARYTLVDAGSRSGAHAG